MAQSEAFSRALIDAQLADAGWQTRDGVSMRFEYPLSDRSRADYLLCDRDGHGFAVVEAKRTSIHAPTAAEQAKHYADLADVPSPPKPKACVASAHGKPPRSPLLKSTFAALLHRRFAARE